MTPIEEVVEPSVVLSVGIPAFNAGKSIEASIRSILRQTWRGTMEILVVDDGSTDDTVAVATRLANEYGAVRVVKHDRNRGRPAARNTILREAKGRFLTWMDADDEWYPNKLAVQFDELLSRPELQQGEPLICMCAFDWKWAHSPKANHRVPDLSGDQLKGLLSGRIGAYLWTMLGTLEAFRNVGEFDQQLPRLQDLDFMIRFVARGGRLIVSDPRRPLCVYHKTDDDKPGRVLAQSLSHIWRKHQPLFRQYGGGFCRGSRRRHFQLAARHGFTNEGRLVGTWYALRAALTGPGWLLAPVKALLRPRGPAKPIKLETLRSDSIDGPAMARNTGRTPHLEVIVSLSKRHDEALRGYLRALDDKGRGDGVWYLPPSIGLPKGSRDHAGLLKTLRAMEGGDAGSVEAERDGIARLLRAAAWSNGDGGSTLMYLGAPIDLDHESTEEVRRSVSTLRSSLQTLGMMLAGMSLQLQPRLHLLVPDTETLLWRRFLAAVASGGSTHFEEWLLREGKACAEVLDHRVMRPLVEGAGLGTTCVQVLAEGALLGNSVQAFASRIGAPKHVLPAPASTAIALPFRNQGLVGAEVLLRSYALAMGGDQLGLARDRFWHAPSTEEPVLPHESVQSWLAQSLDLKPYQERFSPAELSVVSSNRRTPPVHPHELVCPVASRHEYETMVASIVALSSAASLTRSTVGAGGRS